MIARTFSLRPFMFLAAAVLAVLTTGCMTGKDDDDTEDGAGFSVNSEVEVLSITPPSGNTPGTIVTREVDYGCDGGVYVDTVIVETQYAIVDGKLYMWTEGSCLADAVLSGSSETITGTWTGDGTSGGDSVPAAYRPVCSMEYADDPLLEDVSVTYTISPDKIESRSSGKVCLASLITEEIHEYTEGLQVVDADCASSEIRSESRDATLSSNYEDGTASVTFSHDGQTCTMDVYVGLSGEMPDCSEWDEETIDYEFAKCMDDTGFFDGDDAEDCDNGDDCDGDDDDDDLGKKASLSLARGLHKALKNLPPFTP